MGVFLVRCRMAERSFWQQSSHMKTGSLSKAATTA
jgi:hypothetical protein